MLLKSLKRDYAHLISWAIFCQYNTIRVVKFPDFSLILKDIFSPCHFLTCGNDFLTERKVLLAHTLTLSINEIIFGGVNYRMLHVKKPDMVSGVPLHLKQNHCQYMNWQFIYIMYKKIDVLERPTSACHLISWAIFCQYNTIRVVKFPDFSLILKDIFSPCHFLTCGNDFLIP